MVIVVDDDNDHRDVVAWSRHRVVMGPCFLCRCRMTLFCRAQLEKAALILKPVLESKKSSKSDRDAGPYSVMTHQMRPTEERRTLAPSLRLPSARSLPSWVRTKNKEVYPSSVLKAQQWDHKMDNLPGATRQPREINVAYSVKTLTPNLHASIEDARRTGGRKVHDDVAGRT